MGGPQSRSGRFRRIIVLTLAGLEPRTLQDAASGHTDYAITSDGTLIMNNEFDGTGCTLFEGRPTTPALSWLN